MSGRPATLLGQIIRDRMDDLGLSYRDVARIAASKGHPISYALVNQIVNETDLRRFYKEPTLRGIAAGLSYPYEVIHEAAREKFYDVEDVQVTLKTAGTTMLVVAAHQQLDADARAQHARVTEKFSDLTPEQRDELEALAEKYAAELRAAKQDRKRRTS